jgi:hypothetical protein
VVRGRAATRRLHVCSQASESVNVFAHGQVSYITS